MRYPFSFKVLVVTAVAPIVIAMGCQQVASEGEDAAEEAVESTSGSVFGGAASAPKTATLEAGSTLRVRTTSTLSTKAAKSGEQFTASLEEPLVAGAQTIAPKGATVHGTVVESDPGGKVKGVARLAIRLTQLETAGGQTIDITTSTYATQAKTSKKEDAKKIGIGSGVGAAIGAIAGGGKGAAVGAGVGAGAGTGAVLATRGDPAVIPSESVLNFTLREPVTIAAK